MPKILSTYYQEQKTAWINYAKLTIETSAPEPIHKFRTTTKRLRTFFHFVQFLTDHHFEGRKKLNAFKGFYKHLGLIRELQVEGLSVSAYESQLGISLKSYHVYLANREQRERKALLKNTESISFDNDSLPLINEVAALELRYQNTLQIQGSIYYHKKLLKIDQMVRKTASNQHIHAVRRQLKQVNYFAEFMDIQQRDEKLKVPSGDRLREMEQYIGRWHDLLNSKRFMNDYYRTIVFENTASFYEMKNAITLERAKMRKTILAGFYPELRIPNI